MGFIAIAPSECYQNGRLGHPFRKTGVQPKTRKAKTRHTDRQQRCFKKEPSKNPKQTVQCQENLSKSTVFARSQAPWAHLGCIGKGPSPPKIGRLTCLGKPAQRPVHDLQGSGSKRPTRAALVRGPRPPKIGRLTCLGKPAQRPVHGLQRSGSKNKQIHRFFLQTASAFANPKPPGTSLGRGCGEKKMFFRLRRT